MLLGDGGGEKDEATPSADKGAPNKRGRGRPKGATDASGKGKDKDGASAASKGSNGAKRGAKKGESVCRGCKASYDREALSTDSAFCVDCKRLLDRLARVAAREGSEACDYLKEARQDARKISAIIKEFCAKVGTAMPRGRKASCWVSCRAPPLSYRLTTP